MKKILALLLIAALLLTVGACRQKDTTTESTLKTTEETTDGTTEEKTTTVTVVDVDAGESEFVQTGQAYESIIITQEGADSSTIVVDLGELVTLNVYSERLKTTQLYNDDLHVDTEIMRGKTVDVTIEANEEGIFYFTDETTGQTLFRFMVAGTSFS